MVGEIKEKIKISTTSGGIKELLRYKVECSGGWAACQIFSPVFFDNAMSTT